VHVALQVSANTTSKDQIEYFVDRKANPLRVARRLVHKATQVAGFGATAAKDGQYRLIRQCINSCCLDKLIIQVHKQ
jgi:hypothetical protein